jgi:dipeptidyl aminopeptidase/acylaminoacyl peptidase
VCAVRYSLADFLEIRTAAASGFSPDGSKVLVASNLSGTMQLYRTPLTGGELEAITAFEEPVSGTYLPTSDEILFVKDEGGNERHQIYRISDDGRGLSAITSEPEFIHRVGGVTREGSSIAITSNRRNGVDFDVYVRDLETGAERLVFDMGGWCEASGFSPDGRLLAVSRATNRSFDNDVYIVDLESGDRLHVAPHESEASVGSPRWLPDGSGFFFASEIEREFSAIARYDMRERSWEYVIESDWDLSCTIDWPGRSLLVSTNEEGYTHLSLHDPRTVGTKRPVSFPSAGIAGGAFSRDGRYLGLTFVSASEAGDAWIYDTVGDSMSRLTESPNAVPRGVFVTPEVQRFTSFDGESIPIFLYRPRDAQGDVPVVVVIHGGPESQFVPSFNPVVQYLAHRGYAVIAPNVRGSTGYGKRYHRLDDKRKRLDSVRDLEALHGWITSTPGLDATRAALWGGSYGGYMVLAGLAFQPQLWAAGVDIVGISSLATFLENTSPYRRAIREREYGSLAEDREFLVEASPLTRVDDIRAPLFIIHGTNDPRVPLGEAHQLHDALRAKGIATDLLVYEDEGHGLGKLKNRLDAYPKAVDFLDRVLHVE